MKLFPSDNLGVKESYFLWCILRQVYFYKDLILRSGGADSTGQQSTPEKSTPEKLRIPGGKFSGLNGIISLLTQQKKQSIFQHREHGLHDFHSERPHSAMSGHWSKIQDLEYWKISNKTSLKRKIYL